MNTKKMPLPARQRWQRRGRKLQLVAGRLFSAIILPRRRLAVKSKLRTTLVTARKTRFPAVNWKD